MTVTIEEEERQMIILALAILSLDRPGWQWTVEKIVEKFSGREMFENFRTLEKKREKNDQGFRFY